MLWLFQQFSDGNNDMRVSVVKSELDMLSRDMHDENMHKSGIQISKDIFLSKSLRCLVNILSTAEFRRTHCPSFSVRNRFRSLLAHFSWPVKMIGTQLQHEHDRHNLLIYLTWTRIDSRMRCENYILWFEASCPAEIRMDRRSCNAIMALHWNIADSMQFSKRFFEWMWITLWVGERCDKGW
jgi:hypothetical protein